MGWASGSELADNLWFMLRKYVPADKRKDVARKFIAHFEDYDCDTMHECEWLMKDADK